MRKILLISLLLVSTLSKATVHYVSSLNDTGSGSLREMINLAAPNDTIDFSVSGIINLDSPLVINKNLTILSPSADSITINGQNLTHLLDVTAGDVFISKILFDSGRPDTLASGGGINKVSSGILHIENSKFLNCFATHNGGAIVQDTGSLEIISCYFYNNDADSSGGTIQNSGGTIYIYGSTFEQAHSGGSGGAISNAGGIIHVVNSTFYQNSALRSGGSCAGDSINMINCTFTGNTATDSGGAIMAGNGYILNCIIYNNSALSGPDISGDFESYGHNLIGDTSGSTGMDSSDIIGADPLLQPISMNGGFTPTCAIAAGSPCVDAGSCISAPNFDQRDTARIGIPDIGAYEFGGTPFMIHQASDSMCMGDTIFYDNDTITIASTTTHILETVEGCDSIVELTVNIISPDTMVTQSSDTLTASSLADSWQWYDCNNMIIMPDDTMQTFIATANGSYAAIITQSGCTDTSECFLITIVGIDNFTLERQLLVYPSITDDFVKVIYSEKNNGMIKNKIIQILNVSGEIVHSQNFSGSELEIDVKGLKAGVYFLRVERIMGLNNQTRFIKY